MAKISKRLQALRASVDSNKLYAIDEAIATVKTGATAKFDESIDVFIKKQNKKEFKERHIIYKSSCKVLYLCLMFHGEHMKTCLIFKLSLLK